jgi:hypothetical protein
MQKQLLLLVCMVVILSATSFSQASDPKWELFGGYSYLRSNPGGGSDSAHSHGWNASLDYNFTKHLGVKADIDGHYCCDGEKEHNFLFGPQLQFKVKNSRVFAHALAGVSHGSAPLGNFSDTVFAYALGGGFDYPLGHQKRWALRLAQVDYLGTHYADNFQHNFRYSGGIVFDFGKR